MKQGENEITEQLLKQLNKDGKIHVVPARIGNDYIIRFTVTSYYTTEEDINRDWMIIKNTTDQVLEHIENEKINNEKRKIFQSSLMLSNVPQTPKIVNASFLAFLMDQDMTSERIKELYSRDYLKSPLPLTARRSPKLKIYLNTASLKGSSFDQSVNSNYENAENTSLIIDETNKDAANEGKLIELYQKNINVSNNNSKKIQIS